MNQNELDLDPGKPEFLQICRELNQLNIDPQAKATFDAMSGAFMFVDEFPKHLLSNERQLEPLLLPCINLLRYLWGFRQSLILGTKRLDLVHLWHETMKQAPCWPGFESKRSSPPMLPFALKCIAKSEKFSAELDELDERITRIPARKQTHER